MSDNLECAQNFHLIIEKDTLYINASDNVIGVIFFYIDGICFPANNWYDFVVRILTWFTESVYHLMNNIQKNLEVPFMEGCYKIELRLDKSNFCRIDFIEGEKLSGDKEIIHKSMTIPLDILIVKVKKTCKTLLEMSDIKNLGRTDDYKKLRQAYEFLSKKKKTWPFRAG